MDGVSWYCHYFTNNGGCHTGADFVKANQTTVNEIDTRLQSAEVKITPQQINLTVADQIAEKVNAVQVGGRNYIRNSRIVSLDGWNSYNSTLSIQDSSLRVIGNNQYVGVERFSNALWTLHVKLQCLFIAKTINQLIIHRNFPKWERCCFPLGLYLVIADG